jgi:hypothetical protein
MFDLRGLRLEAYYSVIVVSTLQVDRVRPAAVF